QGLGIRDGVQTPVRSPDPTQGSRSRQTRSRKRRPAWGRVGFWRISGRSRKEKKGEPRRDRRRGSLPKSSRLRPTAARRLRQRSLTWLPLHIWDHLLPLEPAAAAGNQSRQRWPLARRTTFVRPDMNIVGEGGGPGKAG